jgi:hypothetical protein
MSDMADKEVMLRSIVGDDIWGCGVWWPNRGLVRNSPDRLGILRCDLGYKRVVVGIDDVDGLVWAWHCTNVELLGQVSVSLGDHDLVEKVRAIMRRFLDGRL